MKMKALLLIAALLPLTATAGTLSVEVCKSFSGLAETVMKNRQHGVDIIKAYDLAGDNKAYQMLVTDAYSKPKFSTATFRDSAISEFKNKYFLYCIK
jgi:hypothetical protein